MKFYNFHLMAWPKLPENFKSDYETAWVTLSNEMYDPEVGSETYQNYVRQLQFADEQGFDGVCVNEHHQTAYGMMPAPNLMAAHLIQQVKGKIAILGNAISLRQNPLRIASEIAMLDVLSKGRIINGFVRGIGAEYHNFSANPTESRERFMEAHQLIIDAWTKKGPFEHYGKYFKLRYVNPWTLPYQKPHPPIWIPSQGSQETIEWVAKNRYTYLQTYSSINSVRRVFKEFHVQCEKHGYKASPEQLGWALPVYVAETDQQAYDEAKEAIDYIFNKAFKMPAHVFFPSGYLTEKSMKNVLASKAGIGTSDLPYDFLIEKGYIMVGSASTVRDKIKEYQKEFNFGHFLPMMHFGNLPHERAMKNIELFAKEVIPHLKHLGEN